MKTELRPTPETDAQPFIPYLGTAGGGDLVTRDFARKLERERDEAKALNRTLLDQLEAKDAQLETMREAIVQLRDSLEVGKDSVETWDWCNKMLDNSQSPTQP